MYYNLEKAAEILSMTPGDLNRLREAGKMRAFRDGNDWKFRKEDIDNHLAETIKNRSKAAMADDADDLLNETEEELPTMLADSTSFESLVSASPEAVKISAHDPADDGVLLDDTQEPDAVVLDETPDDGAKIDGGSSGISLIDDEDPIQTSESGSGISLLDDGLFELGGSNVDLGQEDIILGDGSGSGLNLTGGSGITLGSLSSGGSGSGISLLSDDNLFSLAPGPASEDQAESKPASSAAKADLSPAVSEESEVFALAEDPNKLVQVDGTEDVTILQTSGDEDFQLAPIATGDEDSDSESSSQVIPLEDESLFTSDDSDADQVYGIAGEEAKPAAEMPAVPAPAVPAAMTDDDLGLDLNAGFGNTENDFDPQNGGDLGGDLGGGLGGDLGGGLGGDLDGFGMPGVDTLPPPPETGTAPDFTETGNGSFGSFGNDPGPMPEGFGADTLPVAGGCSYAAGKGCRQDPGYSGLSIGLGLVPCILLLILCGIGAYELIRTIWSWDQPFGLTGTLLETIGGLINLT